MVLAVLGERDLSGTHTGHALDFVSCVESAAVVRVEQSDVDALHLVLCWIQVCGVPCSESSSTESHYQSVL